MTERCKSCDHDTQVHGADGSGCLFKVKTVGRGDDCLCRCTFDAYRTVPCEVMEGATGIRCSRHQGHGGDHEGTHTPRTDGTESVGYPLFVRVPGRRRRCPPPVIDASGWRPATRCVNDTNGDGDCAACAHNPDAPCRQPLMLPTDSETEWGRRWTGTGVVQEFGDRREDAEDACYPNTQLVRREVGPWTEAQP